MEAAPGFEPGNVGFANPCLRPLGHAARGHGIIGLSRGGSRGSLVSDTAAYRACGMRLRGRFGPVHTRRFCTTVCGFVVTRARCVWAVYRRSPETLQAGIYAVLTGSLPQVR
jgi:hypothetical protein